MHNFELIHNLNCDIGVWPYIFAICKYISVVKLTFRYGHSQKFKIATKINLKTDKKVIVITMIVVL